MASTINKFTNVTISASDGNTVPSTSILGYKTYVDIGSGTVLKLSWNTPTATNNAVDSYWLDIKSYDSLTGTAVTTILNKDIGNVNEFYINSALLSSVKYPNHRLDIILTAQSKFGKSYDGVSPKISVYVSKGSGTYVKVSNGYKQPIMKRALAFNKLDYLVLKDSEGKVLLDADEKLLYVKASGTQDLDAGWTLMQNFYSKNNDTWQQSDIRYEVLTDADGEIITDINNDPIYTL